MIRKHANSETVNLHANVGGNGPDAARRLRRSIEAILSGDRWRRARGKAADALCQVAALYGLRCGLRLGIRERARPVRAPDITGELVELLWRTGVSANNRLVWKSVSASST
jgi:hypothetical protein